MVIALLVALLHLGDCETHCVSYGTIVQTVIDYTGLPCVIARLIRGYAYNGLCRMSVVDSSKKIDRWFKDSIDGKRIITIIGVDDHFPFVRRCWLNPHKEQALKSREKRKPPLL